MAGAGGFLSASSYKVSYEAFVFFPLGSSLVSIVYPQSNWPPLILATSECRSSPARFRPVYSDRNQPFAWSQTRRDWWSRGTISELAAALQPAGMIWLGEDWLVEHLDSPRGLDLLLSGCSHTLADACVELYSGNLQTPRAIHQESRVCCRGHW